MITLDVSILKNELKEKRQVMFWLEILIRYGLLIGLGFFLIGISLHRSKKHKEEYSDARYVRTSAWVKSIDTEYRVVNHRTSIIHRIEAEYIVNGEKIISLSQNTIHSEDEYEPGQKIEILYDSQDSFFFYTADDRNFRMTNRIEIVFGAAFAIIGIILLIIHLLQN